MGILTILVGALVLALVLLTVFSLMIISTALNKKNIKLDLFAFDFNFGKLRKGKISDNSTAVIAPEPEVQIGDEGNDEPPAAVIPTVDAPAAPVVAEASKPIQHDNNIVAVADDSENEFDGDEDFEGLVDLGEFDEPSKKSGRATMLMDGVKDRFAQAQNDANARAIAKEERKLQEDWELYDEDETPEEMPDDLGGKLGYWWRNNFGFRIGTCAFVVFLICALVFYGFQMRNHVPVDGNDKVITATDSKNDGADSKDVTDAEKSDETLDDKLVSAGLEEEDPNLAEIVTTAQREVGTTPASYAGSNTTRQPSGSIGTISIPSINLKNAPVMGSVALNDLSKGTGHFENTPVFDGNVGIAGHNNTHFKYLVNVDIGDQIQYTVNGVTRTYQVTDMRAIADTDWGVFTDYGDNRLTLVTCEHLVPNRRIAVTAIQVGSDSGTSNGTVYTGKTNSSFHQDSGDYHDAGSGYTDYIGVFTGNN